MIGQCCRDILLLINKNKIGLLENTDVIHLFLYRMKELIYFLYVKHKMQHLFGKSAKNIWSSIMTQSKPDRKLAICCFFNQMAQTPDQSDKNSYHDTMSKFRMAESRLAAGRKCTSTASTRWYRNDFRKYSIVINAFARSSKPYTFSEINWNHSLILWLFMVVMSLLQWKKQGNKLVTDQSC